MNDAVKHTTGTIIAASGFAFSLKATVEWAQLVCAVCGTIAAICTIHSWWKSRHPKK
jgi:hypothetical protein